MSLYDHVVEGIDHYNTASLELTEYLKSLKTEVKRLRVTYRKPIVTVPYDQEPTQSAYLITYFPHYYQLLHKVLMEQQPVPENTECLNMVFIGGGPGPEVYGAVKYLLECRPEISRLHVDLLDIHAESWRYSHQIVQEYLLARLPQAEKLQIEWEPHYFDLTKPESVEGFSGITSKAQLITIQNCINEIPHKHYPALKATVEALFASMNNEASMLMIDLTNSPNTRVRIKEIEGLLSSSNPIIQSTLDNQSASYVRSVQASPNELVRNCLLDGSDGLIPRVRLHYDYSLVKKGQKRADRQRPEAGFKSLYSPLAMPGLAAKEEVLNRTFIGLDFGTSISVVGAVTFENGDLSIRALELPQKGPRQRQISKSLIPSCFAKSGRQFMLGRYAQEMKADLTYGVNCWYGFKELLGDLSSIEYPDSELRNHEKVRVNNARDALIVYLGQLNRAIRNEINKIENENELCYMVSVPANFPARKRAELRLCLEKAGIPYEDVAFAQEPISALISAVYREDITIGPEEKNLMVIDLGAGTVDVSIMQISKDTDNINSELLSVRRVSNIGGDTINELIANDILKGQKLSEIEHKRLLVHIERTKIDLCTRIKTDYRVSYELPELAASNEMVSINTSGILTPIKDYISYADFRSIMEAYWPQVQETVNQSLNEAKLIQDDVHDVIISGGGARNPYIRHKCHQYLPKANLVIPDDIQEQVALGNALQAFTFFAFGQNIINSRLFSDVYLITGKGKKCIFKNRVITPTFEYRAGPEALIDHTINLTFGEGQMESVKFEVPTDTSPIDIYIWVSADLDIRCSILLENEELELPANYD